MSARSLTAFLGVLAVVGLLGFGLLSKGSGGAAVGEKAPDEPLPRLLTEGSGSPADYRGKWVLVNFWASWCVPCKEESPALQRIQQRLGGKDFTVLGIDTRDLTEDGRAFVARYGLTYPQLRDGDGDRAHDFGTTGVPESFLVDPSGRIVAHYPGPFRDDAAIASFLRPFLKGDGASG